MLLLYMACFYFAMIEILLPFFLIIKKLILFKHFTSTSRAIDDL